MAEIDPQVAELALRLAGMLAVMRGTSRFAVETFIAAAADEDVVAADLTLGYRKVNGGRLEAEVVVGPLNERSGRFVQ